ncbi:hypothetical protein [Pseudomonas sp. MWU12-2323]|uniref:hypothetical protein n=1 Tax=Pseudomonas sp. MWU12-2323 TaxID=2651296 RepID=UPI00128DE878|nr:hypothetical protein [Pseudomonas sp. MWU12-2323]MPQ71508.1 hypothetical protein [Pseudomonas sp. MWU12-2323]
MSLFQCEVCGCRENTAYSMQGFKGATEFYDWSYAPEREGLRLCSACGPSLESSGASTGCGHWHGHFERVFLPLGMFKTGRQGHLEHVETGDQNYRDYAIPAPSQA